MTSKTSLTTTAKPLLELSSQAAKRQAYPEVVFAAPLEQVLEKFRGEIATVRSIMPDAPALPALERFTNELLTALEEASRSDAVLTVEDVARVERVTEQALRKRLEKGLYPGAEKRGGVWRIPKSALRRAA